MTEERRILTKDGIDEVSGLEWGKGSRRLALLLLFAALASLLLFAALASTLVLSSTRLSQPSQKWIGPLGLFSSQAAP